MTGFEPFLQDPVRRRGGYPEFLDRADTDSIGLAEGAIDSTGLRNAHLGTAYQGRIHLRDLHRRSRRSLGTVEICILWP